MGFLEKLKNTFFEEEYVEVPEKVKPEQQKKVTPVFKKIEDDEEIEETKVTKKIEKIEPEVKINNSFEIKEELPKKETKFNYFDDEDFLDDNYVEPVKKVEPNYYNEKKVEVKETINYENSVYGSKKPVINENTSAPYQKEVKQKFKPTPIISPIYGVLDKNYTKDDIVESKEIKPTSSYVSRKNVDLDSIRQKAFGFIDDEIEETNTEEIYTEENINIEDNMDDEIENNLLYDMTDIDKTPSVDKVTLQDAEEYYEDLGLEYNVDYKDAKLERKTGRRVNKAPKLDEIEEEPEMEEEMTPIDENFEIEESIDDDVSLEDNLFDLIDSMYEDKED